MEKGKWNRKAVWTFLASLVDMINELPVGVLLAQGGTVKPLLLLFYSCVLHGNHVVSQLWWDIRVSVHLIISKLKYLQFGDKTFASGVL